MQTTNPAAQRVWQLVSQVAADLLGFPEEALRHFQKNFDPTAFRAMVEDEQIPTFYIQEGERLTGILLGTRPEGGVGTVIWLVIDPGFHRQGRGKALFDRACDFYRAMGCHKIKLTAPSPQALGFYEKMGMNNEGRHDKHWWGMTFWSLGKKLT